MLTTLLDAGRSYLATDAALGAQPIGVERLTAQQTAFQTLMERSSCLSMADAQALAVTLYAWAQGQSDACSGTPASKHLSRLTDYLEHATSALDAAEDAIKDGRAAA